jgi:carnitine 3-dehydrogenase
MQAGILGAGVIGRGWAARFLLHGWDVVIYDADANAPARVMATVNQARRSLTELYDAALPTEGQLRFAESSTEAVQGADWIQESVPESLSLKRDLYQAIQNEVPPGTPVASSTSGFKPTDLACDLACAGQMLVCHPFNPVYLLPAVEVVAGERTHTQTLEKATNLLVAVGMKPITVRREIDAHIADRLLEALWREALWLVADDVATTQEIDDVMRYGFGLRWAQMGLFETYRIAGGEAGMRHFLEQFGPALEWPWSRLTDVPELDDALIQKIAAQSDAQSGQKSIAELERERDENLVAIIRALKATNGGTGSGVGEHVNQLDVRLKNRFSD